MAKKNGKLTLEDLKNQILKIKGDNPKRAEGISGKETSIDAAIAK